MRSLRVSRKIPVVLARTARARKSNQRCTLGSWGCTEGHKDHMSQRKTKKTKNAKHIAITRGTPPSFPNTPPPPFNFKIFFKYCRRRNPKGEYNHKMEGDQNVVELSKERSAKLVKTWPYVVARYAHVTQARDHVQLCNNTKTTHFQHHKVRPSTIL